jgi:tRNA modification GTPase
VGECFVPARGRKLSDISVGRIVLGRWGDVAAATEELVVCRRAPDRIEVHCHGGVATVRAIIDRLVDNGCCPTSWQDWLHKTSRDPIQASAQIALADAPTARTAAILLDQYHGALSGAIREAIAALSSTNASRAAEILDAVLAYRDVGSHLTTPWHVVLVGRPNVGKSSLVNALAGFQRSIVSHQPGTTRDVVTLETAIDGWPVQLADTAGLRATADELESAGVERAVVSLTNADLVVTVSDASSPSEPSAKEFVGSIRWIWPPRVIHVRNKSDLCTAPDRVRAMQVGGNAGGWAEVRTPGESARLLTSAVTGEGIGELISAIGQALVPTAPPAGSAVPFTAQQLAALDAARTAAENRDAQRALTALQSMQAQHSASC